MICANEMEIKMIDKKMIKKEEFLRKVIGKRNLFV
jgi:hypothetical protein